MKTSRDSTDRSWWSWTVDADEAAPSRHVTPRTIHRAAVDSGGLPFSMPPAAFLLIPTAVAWLDAPGPGAVVVTMILVVYGVLFVYGTGVATFPVRVRLTWFAAGCALLLLLVPLIGEDILYMVMFQAMSHMMLLPWRWAVPSMIVMCVLVSGLAIALGLYFVVGLALFGMVMSWGVGHGIRQQMLEERLEAAEKRNAVLAVAAERERIGRDLHDIVGHSLTSLTISAQLARRLLETDPDAARDQLEHIEGTVRQALSDVRATASGMQHVRAASEVASARNVLTTLGIEVEAPTALPPLDDEHAELFGYVIREATTNIVRHARAGSARITVEPERVSVADDGVGMPARAARSGLRGLEGRVRIAGGRLHVGSGAEGRGTRITAEMDGAGSDPPTQSPAGAVPAPGTGEQS